MIYKKFRVPFLQFTFLMNPRGCVCPRSILTMGSVSWYDGRLRRRRDVTAILSIDHLLLVVVVLKVEVERTIGKFVFDNLQVCGTKSNVGEREWLIDLKMINIFLFARNSLLRHCSPSLLETTPSSNLSHPNWFDCLTPPEKVRNEIQLIKTLARGPMKCKLFSTRLVTSRELFWRRWMNCPINVWGLLSVKESQKKRSIVEASQSHSICNAKRLCCAR